MRRIDSIKTLTLTFHPSGAVLKYGNFPLQNKTNFKIRRCYKFDEIDMVHLSAKWNLHHELVDFTDRECAWIAVL